MNICKTQTPTLLQLSELTGYIKSKLQIHLLVHPFRDRWSRHEHQQHSDQRRHAIYSRSCLLLQQQQQQTSLK